MEYVQQAFDAAWLTNRGPLVRRLEDSLRAQLGVDHIIAMCNGTIPLQIALKQFAPGTEVITTPFSYVATAASVAWEHLVPVFVDIERDTFTIDPEKIVSAISERTRCILATHVFGNPCDVKAIHDIAKQYDLLVVYDAAHCFGVDYCGQSVFLYGDVSTCSFHATKLFHTAEGGALFTSNEEIYSRALLQHSFGHKGPDDYITVGVNGKLSEIHAAMGLAMLRHMDYVTDRRRVIVEAYRGMLDCSPLETMALRPGTSWNYSYFPVIYPSESALTTAMGIYNTSGIFPRRYFYPALNTIQYLNPSKMEIAEAIASRVLCLPLYPDLASDELDHVCSVLKTTY